MAVDVEYFGDIVVRSIDHFYGLDGRRVVLEKTRSMRFTKIEKSLARHRGFIVT